MEDFLKWIKNTFDTNLPNDYLQFLLSYDESSVVGKVFQFFENEKLTSTDIHYFFKIGKNKMNCIEWNYNNYLSEDIIPAFFLPIAEDSGGNLICLSMDVENYSRIYFVLHDSFEMTYFFVANSFSEWCSKMYSQQINRQNDESNTIYTFKKYGSEIYSNGITKDSSNVDVSEFSYSTIDEFMAREKIDFPLLLYNFYSSTDGIEINRKIEFICKKTKFSVEISTVLPFDEAEKKYYKMAKSEPKMADYFPIAISSNINFIALLKVRKKNKGKIYFWNAFNRDIVEAYDSADDFLGELGIEPHSLDES